MEPLAARRQPCFLVMVLTVALAACLVSACQLDRDMASDKAITAFSISDPQVSGVISQDDHTIRLSLPYGTDLSSLVPTVEHNGATLSPPSGQAQDFRESLCYTVTAEDGGRQNYRVICGVDAGSTIDGGFWGQWYGYGPANTWYFASDKILVGGAYLCPYGAADGDSLEIIGGLARPEGGPDMDGIELPAGTMSLEGPNLIRFNADGLSHPYYLYRARGPGASCSVVLSSSLGGPSLGGLRLNLVNEQNPGDAQELILKADGRLELENLIVGDGYALTVPIQDGIPKELSYYLYPAFDGQELGSLDLSNDEAWLSVNINADQDRAYADGESEYSLSFFLSNRSGATKSYTYSASGGDLSLSESSAQLSGIADGSSASVMLKLKAPDMGTSAAEYLDKEIRVDFSDGQTSWGGTYSLRFFRPRGFFTLSLGVPAGASYPCGLLLNPDGEARLVWESAKIAWNPGAYSLIFGGGGATTKTKYSIGLDAPASANFRCLTRTSYSLGSEAEGVVVEPGNDAADGALPIPYGGTALQYLDASDVDYFSFSIPKAKLSLSANLEPAVYWDAKTVSALSPSVSGAKIRYTTDFSEPSATAGTLWSGSAVSVDEDHCFYAYVYLDGYAGQLVRLVDRARMVRVAAGGFDNGFGAVSLSAFQLSNHEVSMAEWADMGFGSYASLYGLSGAELDHLPAVAMSWHQAIVYCNRRSIAEGLEPVYSINGNEDPDYWLDMDGDGTDQWPTTETSDSLGKVWNAVVMDPGKDGYRLPTEAEWEYAARGAGATQNYLYAGSDELDEVDWDSSTSGGRPHAPGEKPPNRLGLYNMSANVREWCWDWYSASLSSAPLSDPGGPASGSERVMRSLDHYAALASGSGIGSRFGQRPDIAYYSGFRVCRSVIK